LDLELQLRKVKHVLLTKNVDISAIQPNVSSQSSVIEWLSNRSNNENDDELLQRMEQIMLELTRVIETIEEHQNTEVHTTNPLDNPNSFSNTIHLY
jgi:predicted Abi (CAAX) family protease